MVFWCLAYWDGGRSGAPRPSDRRDLEAARLVMQWLLGMLQQVPSSFWGIVFGSGLSLGGVLAGVILTNRANDKRLRTQFEHDRELRIKDRELALRKDIYMEAVEALSAGVQSIGRFVDLDIANAKVTESYTEKAPAVAKLHVIANEETVQAVATITGELTAIFLRLFAKRVPLAVQKARLAALDDQMAGFAKTRDEMLELMKQFNLEVSTDQPRWAAMQRNFDFEAKRVADALQQKSIMNLAFLTGQIELAEYAFNEIGRINQLIGPAVFAVRRELELPIDEVRYQRMIEQLNQKQRKDLQTFLDQMSAIVKNQAAPTQAQQGAP